MNGMGALMGVRTQLAFSGRGRPDLRLSATRIVRNTFLCLQTTQAMVLGYGSLNEDIAPQSGVSNSFPPGVTSASQLPSKGRM